MKKKPVQPHRKRLKRQRVLEGEIQPPRKREAGDEADSGQTVVPYDENLLERIRTQWQFGDWASLARLDRDTVQHHPDRAKLALLAAAGCLQTSNTGAARQFIRLAQDWGCSRKLVGRILVAGVYNSLGRAAAISGNLKKSLQHFENSLAIGSPGSDSRLLAKARTNQQFDELGLLPGSQGRLQQIEALSRMSNDAGPIQKIQARAIQVIDTTAYAFYKHMDEQTLEGATIPFLLLDSKSLPRSGLHYLKNTLARLLAEHFSFCEWYHEVGCCKKRPCALSGFALYAQESGKCRLRLIKSHDFDLADPVLEPNAYLRRLILVRDPLFILTSWFTLEQLELHRVVLQKQGINTQKLWLSHEMEVLVPAYRLLDQIFEAPSVDRLAEWLSGKSRYIAGFMDKWVKPAIEMPSPYVHVVSYENIDTFILHTTKEYREHLSDAAKTAVDTSQRLAGSQFRKRSDPFAVPAESVTAYLDKHSAMFKEAANQIMAADESGYFRSHHLAADRG